jgi:tetratricopeptide (TPR) repeat protein
MTLITAVGFHRPYLQKNIRFQASASQPPAGDADVTPGITPRADNFQLLEAGLLRAALTANAGALRSNPEHRAIRQAEALMDLRLYEAAEAALQDVPLQTGTRASIDGAKVHLALGKVYITLADQRGLSERQQREKADRHLKEALGQLQEVMGQGVYDHKVFPVYAEVLDTAIRFYESQNSFGGAAMLRKQRVELTTRLHGPNDVRLAEDYRSLGVIHSFLESGNKAQATQDAEGYFGKALAIYDKLVPKIPALKGERLKVLEGLGKVQTTLAKYPEAEATFLRALEDCGNNKGKGYAGILKSELYTVYEQSGQTDKAAALLKDQ